MEWLAFSYNSHTKLTRSIGLVCQKIVNNVWFMLTYRTAIISMGDKIRNIPNKKIGWSKFKHILQRMGIHQTNYEAITNYGNFYVSH